MEKAERFGIFDILLFGNLYRLKKRFLNFSFVVAPLSNIIGEFDVPFRVPPLEMKESRVLWQSLRKLRGIDNLKAKFVMEVDLPYDWLLKKPKAKTFRKTR